MRVIMSKVLFNNSVRYGMVSIGKVETRIIQEKIGNSFNWQDRYL
jgi:hypothetical protein